MLEAGFFRSIYKLERNWNHLLHHGASWKGIWINCYMHWKADQKRTFRKLPQILQVHSKLRFLPLKAVDVRGRQLHHEHLHD